MPIKQCDIRNGYIYWLYKYVLQYRDKIIVFSEDASVVAEWIKNGD